jgi:hypothetical protein
MEVIYFSEKSVLIYIVDPRRINLSIHLNNNNNNNNNNKRKG